MKFTEQTLRELLFEPHTIKELMKEPTEKSLMLACHFQEVAKAKPAEAFHVHVELCPACSNHIKAMCNEGRRLLNEWAISHVDSRIN